MATFVPSTFSSLLFRQQQNNVFVVKATDDKELKTPSPFHYALNMQTVYVGHLNDSDP